jgi:Uma2 family endonuclease
MSIASRSEIYDRLYSQPRSKSKRVAIYHIDKPVEILEAPASLSGEDVLLGFVLNLENIWSA